MSGSGRPFDRSAAVRAYLDGSQPPAVARDAATVVLLRDGPGGLETFLLHRPGRMAFAAGMYVYPGGSVDPSDREDGCPWSGPPPDRWAPVLGGDVPLARAVLVAAVRETFEEAGVLLAGGDEPTQPAQLSRWRAALRDGSSPLSTILAGNHLPLRSDLLVPWARWVTPEFSPRRFDTRFFVAPLPPGQTASEDGEENDDGRWVPVRAALAAYRRGEMPMMMVTAAALRDLAPYASVQDVPAGGRDLTPLMLRAVEHPAGFRYVIDVRGVPVSEEDFMADEGIDGTPHVEERSSR